QTTSLLAKNADLKAQIQEKVFAIAALKNELRKLKGNSVDTKSAKTSVEVNSRTKIQSHKNRNSNKPIDQKIHRFSPNNTFSVYEKTSPRSDLRWKPTGKLFDSCTSKDDSETIHGSNVDISKIHECKQTLDLSAGTSLNVQKEQSLDLSTASFINVKEVPTADMISMTTMIEFGSLFGPFFDEYFNEENQVFSKSFAFTTADTSDTRQQQLDSTSSTSTLASTVTADGNFDL
nr:hypothetical protein [Tanacetum cinerariifolium]